MSNAALADDLLRFLSVGNAWEFTPPLPPQWARRMRSNTATHPSGATLELTWTLTGGIAGRTLWTGSTGVTVDFNAIVPGARNGSLHALLTQPDATEDQAHALVASAVNGFWSPEPFALNERIRDSVLDQPDDKREAMQAHIKLIEDRIESRRRRAQLQAVRRGWTPPASL